MKLLTNNECIEKCIQRENGMKAVNLNRIVFYLGVMVLSAPLYSEDQPEEANIISTTEEHVEINSRPMGLETESLMLERRMAELDEIQVDRIENEDAQKEGEISARHLPVPPLVPPMPYSDDTYAMRIPIRSSTQQEEFIPPIPIKAQRFALLTSDQMIQATAANYSPHLYHYADGIPYQNVIRLEDGSEWTYSGADADLVRSWRKGDHGDALVLSPKITWIWGSDFSYTLTNRTQNTSIDVNPFKGPVSFGHSSTWVVGLDYYNGRAYIMHNQPHGEAIKSTWAISSSDNYLFKDWQINDHVIIAENNNWVWWLSPFNYVIINVNMNHYVRARLL